MSDYAGNDYNSGAVPPTNGTLTPAHSAGIIVGVCVLALVAVRMGYRGVSVTAVTGGLVKG